MLARGNARRLAMLDRLSQMTQQTEDTHRPDDIAAEAEVRQLVAELTPQQWEICLALMDGESIYQFACRTGRHYETICRHVRRIRQAFTNRGLDQWFA